ncbi:hypothetical protein [Geobacter sp. SVR]|uniref:hypothetical protein n=1 Tax=Geobacter sp. SVR TaxID=2495594 RepID=UPI00143F02EA|nr:hypothetical protein [Geobacter sp. SVR]BCS55390.1 hypothetical protein GSVR_36980 [Geobacter sp. SVR]GCF87313.1 hypothetical protein GSbR_39130 [Geobacter sp. SVR]
MNEQETADIVEGGMQLESAICKAIGKRAVLRFTYNGYLRIVEPQSHGISTAGKEVLRGVQTGGGSASGPSLFGKLFEVGKMAGLGETGAVFAGPGIGFNPDDKGMIYVHCHLQPPGRHRSAR